LNKKYLFLINAPGSKTAALSIYISAVLFKNHKGRMKQIVNQNRNI